MAYGSPAASPSAPMKFALSGPYQPRGPEGGFVCYVCRYEMDASEAGLSVANRFLPLLKLRFLI